MLIPVVTCEASNPSTAQLIIHHAQITRIANDDLVPFAGDIAKGHRPHPPLRPRPRLSLLCSLSIARCR
jgi:hypothetical protein